MTAVKRCITNYSELILVLNIVEKSLDGDLSASSSLCSFVFCFVSFHVELHMLSHVLLAGFVCSSLCSSTVVNVTAQQPCSAVTNIIVYGFHKKTLLLHISSWGEKQQMIMIMIMKNRYRQSSMRCEVPV